MRGAACARRSRRCAAVRGAAALRVDESPRQKENKRKQRITRWQRESDAASQTNDHAYLRLVKRHAAITSPARCRRYCFTAF